MRVTMQLVSAAKVVEQTCSTVVQELQWNLVCMISTKCKHLRCSGVCFIFSVRVIKF